MFKCPFTAMICGATGSGKTTLIRNLIYYKNNLFTSKPVKVIIFYTEYQKIYEEMLKSGLADEVVDLDEKMISLEEYKKKFHHIKIKEALCVFLMIVWN